LVLKHAAVEAVRPCRYFVPLFGSFTAMNPPYPAAGIYPEQLLERGTRMAFESRRPIARAQEHTPERNGRRSR